VTLAKDLRQAPAPCFVDLIDLAQYPKLLFGHFLVVDSEPHSACIFPSSTSENWTDRCRKDATPSPAEKFSGKSVGSACAFINQADWNVDHYEAKLAIFH
jgi:hypothetical protein